jgi:hypothetical protein
LYVGDPKSEIDNYISQYKIGWSFDWSEEENIIEFLNNISEVENLEKIGQASRKFILSDFTQGRILSRYKELI